MNNTSDASSGDDAVSSDSSSTALEEWPWYEVIFSAVMLTATVIFIASSISHMVVAWNLRKDLSVAVRSPRLGLLSGAVSTAVFGVSIFRVMIVPAQAGQMLKGTVVEVVTLPAVFACFTCAYGFRAIRLLIMYNPNVRKFWGKVLDESRMVKVLVGIYAILELTAWSASLVYGADRVKGYAFLVSMSGATVTIAMCFTFVGTLRKTKDIFNLSVELQKVGAFAIMFLFLGYPISYLPVRFQRYHLVVCLVLRYPSAVWFTNIEPMRAVLKNKPEWEKEGVVYSLFPYVPQGLIVKVAVLAGDRRSSSTRPSKSVPFGTEVNRILTFPPLLEAFRDFCQKALCSESLHFLVEADAFAKSLDQPAESHDDTFEAFTKIVDTFIKDNSAFEINIDFATKKRILAMADEAEFKKTSSDVIAHILDDAAQEISRMIQDNLYHKFAATAQFKDINNMLFSPDASNTELT